MRRAILSVTAACLLASACAGPAVENAAVPPPSPSIVASRPPSPSPSPKPSFDGTVGRLDRGVRKRMGTSWRPGCPVHLRDLRVLRMSFWSFKGDVRRGEMIVHERYAEDVLWVFEQLFDARFPIANMEVANGYLGDDPRYAQMNHTVGFNCRKPVGSRRRWSDHAYGRAVDVNPHQNPYVSGRTVIPPKAGAYVDRSKRRKGMIFAGDVVVRSFEKIGWHWGGRYKNLKDYHHFSATGR